jgi:hypothetical protein
LDGNGNYAVETGPSLLPAGTSTLSLQEFSLPAFQLELEVDMNVNVFGLN